MPLLHVRAATTSWRARVHDDRRCARCRAGGCERRLPRGALHARRQTRAALSHRARGARRARMPDDSRVRRARGICSARGNRIAAAPQPRRPDRRRRACTTRRQRVDGADARDDVRSLVGTRWSALRIAGQRSARTAADDSLRRGRARSVHDRNLDRDRRDACRAHRCAACNPGPRAALRTRAGGDRSELSRKARNADGARAGTVPRRAPVDDCGRPDSSRCARASAGASEPVVRRFPATPRRRHRRLGRRLSRHRRPCQPGSAVARDRTPACCMREPRVAARASSGRLSGVDRRCVDRSPRHAARAARRRCDGSCPRRRLGAGRREACAVRPARRVTGRYARRARRTGARAFVPRPRRGVAPRVRRRRSFASRGVR